MTITAEHLFSWPVALWLAVSALVIAVVCLAAARTRAVWQRIFCRAAVIALCLTPVPALAMFTEAAMAGHAAVVPLWYVLFWSIVHASVLGAVLALVVWLVVASLFWVAGMSIHRLLGSGNAAKHGFG
jgi:hypothetical protein